MTPEFIAFPKLARLHRDITITEKIDGTNAAVVVTAAPYGYGDGEFVEGGTVVNLDRESDGWNPVLVAAQSRKRLITPDADNFGFARWVADHADELAEGLGEGHHFGEWYGLGIQRGYGLDHKRFALFNTHRWGEDRPACCDVVPVLCHSTADRLNAEVHTALCMLRDAGSAAVPQYLNPEGIVVFHHAAGTLFKVTLEKDDQPKSVAA